MISTDPQIGCFKKLTLFCCYFCCWSTLGLFLLPQLYKENRMVGMSYAHWWVGLVSRVCGADPSFSSSVWNWCGSRYGISGVWVPPLWCSGYLVTSLQLTQGTGIRRANCHPAVMSPNSTPPPTHTHTSTFPRWFWVTLMWNTNSLSWLDSFPIWSACDPQEHVIPFIKLEERGQVRKRKEQGGLLFFKNQMKRRQPYLFSGMGHTWSCGFVSHLGSGCSTATGKGPHGVMRCWLPQSRQGSMKQTRGNPMPRAPVLRASFVKAGCPHYVLTTPRTPGGKPEPAGLRLPVSSASGRRLRPLG